MYKGVYYGKQRHPNDIEQVLRRARESGCLHCVLLGTSHSECLEAISIAKQFNDASSLDSHSFPKLHTTVGIHPTRCNEFLVDGSDGAVLLKSLTDIVKCNKETVIAIGEIGIDYDRTHFCDISTQRSFFLKQLQWAKSHFPDLPLILHMRDDDSQSSPSRACIDVVNALRTVYTDGTQFTAIVHSFTGTQADIHHLLSLNPGPNNPNNTYGVHIGINGSLFNKHANNTTALTDIFRELPVHRLHFETDSPYCDVKAQLQNTWKCRYQIASAPEKWKADSLVKRRNEPCLIAKVAHMSHSYVSVTNERNPMSFQHMCEEVFVNTKRVLRIV